MKKTILFFLIGLLLISFSACRQTTQEPVKEDKTGAGTVGYDVAATELLSDDELIDRTIYLFDMYVLPVYWWTGAGSYSLDVDEFGEPLEDTPEGTVFHAVLRFNSIAEMKRATEQVVTKEYAEKFLYPYLGIDNQFMERDGLLYYDTEKGGGATPFSPASATVLSKSEDEALLLVTFEDFYGEQEAHEVELKRENGIWKLNSFPYLNPIEGTEIETASYDRFNATYVTPVFVSGMARDSWEAAEDIEPERFGDFIAALSGKDSDIQLDSYEVDEQTKSYLMLSEDYERLIQKYFDVSTPHLRSSRYYDEELGIYEIIGVGSASDSRVTGAVQEGDRLIITFQSYQGDATGNAYTITVQLLNGGDFRYVSCERHD